MGLIYWVIENIFYVVLKDYILNYNDVLKIKYLWEGLKDVYMYLSYVKYSLK